MKKLLTIVITLLTITGVDGQTVLVFQNVEQDSIYSLDGPNRLYYESVTFGLEGFAGPSESEGAQLDYARSYGLFLGSREKYKVSNFYNLGHESIFTYRSYSIDQNPNKVFASPQQHSRERLNVMQYSLQLFQRFNFTKRGDHLGTYLDLGAFGYWTFWRRHVTVDDVIIDGFTQTQRVIRRHLDYINPLGYGGFVRLGFNWFMVKAEYRLVSLFKDIPKLGYTDLPKIAISISVDIPQN